jgi:hypothetical protein
MVRHLLSHPRASDLDLDHDAVLARFEPYDPRWRHLLRVALTSYAEGRGASHVVEKTPAHLAHVPRILSWFPNAKIVLVVRDGRDAVMSMLAAPFTHGDIRRHACNWRRMADLGEDLARRYPANLHEIRFEDLVEHPRETLALLHDFLGIDLDPGQLLTRPASDAIPLWEAAWKARAISTLDPSRVGVWRRSATTHQRWAMNAIMGQTLFRLGYSDTALYDAPLPTRVRHRMLARLWRTALMPSVRPVTTRAWRGIRRTVEGI